MMESKALKLKDIRIDGDTQPRAEIDESLVTEYAEAMNAGASFPPLIVFHDGRHYWLADGFHRFHAARTIEMVAFTADVREGTKVDAQWFACAANQAHGLRRTNDDKRRAVLTALKHPNAVSNRQIAEHVGVDEATVRKYRTELEMTAEIPQSPTRTGRDGRTINTEKIGQRAGVAKDWPCHHCGGRHPIGENPCHDRERTESRRGRQVAKEYLESTKQSPEFTTAWREFRRQVLIATENGFRDTGREAIVICLSEAAMVIGKEH